MALSWRDQSRYREFYLNIVNLYKQKADLRAFLEIILSLSTITIFTLFALKPTVLTIISLVREINEKKIVVAGLTKKIKDLEIAGDTYIQNQEIIPIIDNAISTLPAPEVFSKQILALAGKNNVNVMGLSMGQVTLLGSPPVKKGKSDSKPLPENPSEMPFSVSVRGNYSDLSNFIRDLENLRIAAKIDLLGINSSNTENGMVVVSVVSGRIPYLGEKTKNEQK